MSETTKTSETERSAVPPVPPLLCLPCLPYATNRWFGVVPQEQLLQLVDDPGDHYLDRFRSMRPQTPEEQKLLERWQEAHREVEDEKKRNVERYAAYLKKIRGGPGHGGKNGFAPPVTLYTPMHLAYEKRGGMCVVQIPADRKWIAIDGATQIAARHRLSQSWRATDTDPVAIVVIHGEPLSYAIQACWDLNSLRILHEKAESAR